MRIHVSWSLIQSCQREPLMKCQRLWWVANLWLICSTNAREMSMKKNVSSSQRGKDKLIDNNGYTFTYRKTYASGNILWRCSVRNKATTCFASVTQAGDTFTKGGQPHCHQPTPGTATTAKVSREGKDVAMSNFFTSAASIVDRVILSQEDNDPCILKPSNLARQGNRKRQKQRPNNPTEIDFNLEDDHIPSDFFLADISNNDRRHLLFATDRQLQCQSLVRRRHLQSSQTTLQPTFQHTCVCTWTWRQHQAGPSSVRPNVRQETKWLSSCPDRTQIKTAREYQPCKDRRQFGSILLEGSQAARNLPRDSTPRLPVPLDTGSMAQRL